MLFILELEAAIIGAGFILYCLHVLIDRLSV